MSLSRMNAEERASYFIGQAVLRHLKDAPRNSETLRDFEAIERMITQRLTAEEYGHVCATTGYLFGMEDDDEAFARNRKAQDPSKPPPGPDDDDMPF
jgi:hypothetical protein